MGKLSPHDLSRLSDFLATRLGWHYDRPRWPDMEANIGLAARDFGYSEAQEFVQWLLSVPLSKAQIDKLAPHFTIGETFFFRDRQSLEAIQQQIFPQLMKAHQEHGKCLRIWSAACCTGEEPYSLAILLREMPVDWTGWHISILGTDINSAFLQKAVVGEYGEWSFRSAPAWLTQKYFTRTATGRYTILPQVKRMVTFSYLNLAEDNYPSPLNGTNTLDLILCRNVLIYFTREQQQKVAQKLHRSLVEGGYLAVSASETSQELFAEFRTFSLPGVTLYRKEAVSEPLKQKPLPVLAPLPPLKTQTPTWPKAATSMSTPVTRPAPTRNVAHSINVQRSHTDVFAVANALYEQGQYAEAAQKLETMLKSEPGHVAAGSLLVRAYTNDGQLAQALQSCDRLVAANPRNATLHYLRATILLEQGAEEEAIEAFKRTVHLDANAIMAHFTLGNLLRQQGQWREAQRHFFSAQSLLKTYQRYETIADAEGLTAEHLLTIVDSLLQEHGRTP